MITWNRTSFGYEAQIGEGALILIVFYEHGWKVGINDRAVKHEYPDVETAKRAAISWAREKLKLFAAELRELETPWVTPAQNVSDKSCDTLTTDLKT